MRVTGSWNHRGFAIAAIALTLTVVTPLATSAAAVSSSRIERAAKKSAVKGRPARPTALQAPVTPRKSVPLSLPLIVILAVAPFVLMAIYLLGADYLRRRVPRKRHRSLVITRVRDR
jgi:ABC-type Fe3+ transport system permease subunit